MIGIVLISHGNFAEHLVKSAELIVGKQEKVTSVHLLEGESLEKFEEKLRKAIKTVKSSDGVLILADLFGGSTVRVAARFLFEEENVEVVAGVNMPMLLEVLLNREHKDLKSLVKIAIDAGKNGVVDFREKLSKNKVKD
ncbi:MAG: PTS sugar transporter subunit IIA [Candidatus Baldrarchaeia archaeon]